MRTFPRDILASRATVGLGSPKPQLLPRPRKLGQTANKSTAITLLHVNPTPNLLILDSNTKQIAGFFTGGSLAIRGGYKAARNGAISCAILLAVIEGVGIGFQKMFAGATKLEVS